MRALIIGDWPPPYGGISVHVVGLRALLRAEGWETRVLDVARPRKPEPPAPDVVPIRGAMHLAREILAEVSRGAVVHVHICGHHRRSWTLAGAAVWLARAWNAAVLVTVHSGLAPAYLGPARRRLLVRAACGPADRVLCANEEILRSLRRCDLRPGRLEVLPAFLAVGRGVSAPPLAVASLAGRCDPILAVSLGDGPEYGGDLLLAALDLVAVRFPRLGLFALGSGSRGPWEAKARERVGDRLVALGELPHRDALGVLAASTVFVRPTLTDGDSVSVREALSLGVPVAATGVAPRPAGAHVAVAEPGPLAEAVVEAVGEGRRGPVPAGSADARLVEIYRALGRRGPAWLPEKRTA